MKPPRSSTWTALILLTLPLAACSSSRPNQKASSEDRSGTASNSIGQAQETQGVSNVQTQKQVTKTETETHQIPTVKRSEVKADINRMTAKDFEAFGFPRDVSLNIQKYRETYGPFRNVTDLEQVPGVDSSLLSRVQNKLGVSGTG